MIHSTFPRCVPCTLTQLAALAVGECRLSLAAAYELDDKSRLGLQIAHVSNAGLDHRNPDDNEVLVTLSLPLHLQF